MAAVARTAAATAPPLPPLDIAALSTTDRTDYVGIGADGINAAGQAVQVALHVLEGLIVELEVFAGDGVTADAPAANALEHVALI